MHYEEKHAKQNRGTIICNGVRGPLAPNEKTTFKVGPGFYSLSTLSTCPYVSFAGMGTREKIFSWGEIVEVPKKALCTVVNRSYHAGMIVLNQGRDYGAIPARVTVPVPLVPAPGGGGLMRPQWPADVRRARRAYAYMARTAGVLTGITRIGRALQQPHDTDTQAPENGYTQGVIIAAATAVNEFPLGYSAEPGILAGFDSSAPMALLDTAIIEFDPNDFVAAQDQIYYVMEYS